MWRAAERQTPFWWGAQVSTELANYDGKFTLSDGPKGKPSAKPTAGR